MGTIDALLSVRKSPHIGQWHAQSRDSSSTHARLALMTNDIDLTHLTSLGHKLILPLNLFRPDRALLRATRLIPEPLNSNTR